MSNQTMLCSTTCPQYHNTHCKELEEAVEAGKVCRVAKVFEDDVRRLLDGMNELSKERGNHLNMKEERLKNLKEWFLKFKDKEEEEKPDPAWKKLRPSGDAMRHRLPGSFGKKDGRN